MPRSSAQRRAWVDEAVRRVDADANRSADTHSRLPLAVPGIELYLKDESVHRRLPQAPARASLFLYALCNGWIGLTHVVEASSGSTL